METTVLPGDSEWKQEALRKALEGGYETVVGVFPTPASATQALNALHAAGFTGEEVALVGPPALRQPMRSSSRPPPSARLKGSAAGW